MVLRQEKYKWKERTFALAMKEASRKRQQKLQEHIAKFFCLAPFKSPINTFIKKQCEQIDSVTGIPPSMLNATKEDSLISGAGSRVGGGNVL